MREHLVRAGRDLAYLSIALLSSIVAFAVFVTGVSVSLSFAIFIIGIPVILLTAELFRRTVEIDRRNAVLALGEPIRGMYRADITGSRWARATARLRDPQVLRDTGWLALHAVLGFVAGTVALGLLAEAGALATLPIWYWAADSERWGIVFWDVDTLPMALVTALLAIPMAGLTVVALRLLTIVHSRAALALLGRRASEAPPEQDAPPIRLRVPTYRPGIALAVHATVVLVVGAVCTIIWWATGGYFWPMWPWLGLLLSLVLHLGVARLVRAPDAARRVQAGAELAAGLALACLAIWLMTDRGYFWPFWPMLGLAIVVLVAALGVFGLRPLIQRKELTERVETLTRTRRDTVDAQEMELRRIERDLHDGAQARLVSLSMKLGRAESRLTEHPDAADLLREARAEAGAAIAELRDLSRGIAPPVLTDRGLVAAVQALAARMTIPVDVTSDLGDARLPPSVESCAYFVCAEALTNIAKHAPAASADVHIARDGDTLRLTVRDDGPGGADPAGGGLTGIRRRAEAIDGRLTVMDGADGGTEVRVELPCGS